MAYGSQRTLVVESKNWKYHSQGFEEVFHPLSENCTDASGANRSIWPGFISHNCEEMEIIPGFRARLSGSRFARDRQFARTPPVDAFGRAS